MQVLVFHDCEKRIHTEWLAYGFDEQTGDKAIPSEELWSCKVQSTQLQDPAHRKGNRIFAVTSISSSSKLFRMNLTSFSSVVFITFPDYHGKRALSILWNPRILLISLFQKIFVLMIAPSWLFIPWNLARPNPCPLIFMDNTCLGEPEEGGPFWLRRHHCSKEWET